MTARSDMAVKLLMVLAAVGVMTFILVAAFAYGQQLVPFKVERVACPSGIATEEHYDLNGNPYDGAELIITKLDGIQVEMSYAPGIRGGLVGVLVRNSEKVLVRPTPDLPVDVCELLRTGGQEI